MGSEQSDISTNSNDVEIKPFAEVDANLNKGSCATSSSIDSLLSTQAEPRSEAQPPHNTPHTISFSQRHHPSKSRRLIKEEMPAETPGNHVSVLGKRKEDMPNVVAMNSATTGSGDDRVNLPKRSRLEQMSSPTEPSPSSKLPSKIRIPRVQQGFRPFDVVRVTLFQVQPFPNPFFQWSCRKLASETTCYP